MRSSIWQLCKNKSKPGFWAADLYHQASWEAAKNNTAVHHRSGSHSYVIVVIIMIMAMLIIITTTTMESVIAWSDIIYCLGTICDIGQPKQQPSYSFTEGFIRSGCYKTLSYKIFAESNKARTKSMKLVVISQILYYIKDIYILICSCLSLLELSWN